ncbi:hypothetical protein Z949_654 [Sulfitobacter guttiformis KCTC 32187]|nr:hypothetical protein Z949_654 [Sulfitobacter guttiformis KCTC 32187]
MVGTPDFQSHLYGAEHGLFIMVHDQLQDIDHLPISSRLALKHR